MISLKDTALESNTYIKLNFDGGTCPPMPDSS